MSRLNLSAMQALSQLLACWVSIGTVGDNALYKRMFLTPTLLEDTGAQTATIAGPVNTNDVLTTVINGVKVPYTVQASDMQATNPITTIAGNIANNINATSKPDPTTGLQLNKRIYANASSQPGVIVIQAVFTLDCSVVRWRNGNLHERRPLTIAANGNRHWHCNHTR